MHVSSCLMAACSTMLMYTQMPWQYNDQNTYLYSNIWLGGIDLEAECSGDVVPVPGQFVTYFFAREHIWMYLCDSIGLMSGQPTRPVKDDAAAIQVELLEELLQHFETGVPQWHFVSTWMCVLWIAVTHCCQADGARTAVDGRCVFTI